MNNMNMKPETSVVITCYNYGTYLEGCLRSVLEQTYKDYEIIVVDDGSTDNTQEVMRSFVDLPSLRYIRQENSGQAKAKNRGIQLARGHYIAFLDADDQWARDKLKKQIKLFERLEVGVVYSRANLIDAEGGISEPGDWGEYLRPRSGLVTNWLFIDNFVWFSSAVLRKSLLKQHGVFDESLPMGIDWDLWLRLSLHCEFKYVDEPLLLYRMGHAGQMSKNIEMRFACSDRIMQRFLDANPGRLRKQTIRKAYALTYCSRGRYYLQLDRWRAFRYFFRSLRLNPLDRAAYIGLARAVVGT